MNMIEKVADAIILKLIEQGLPLCTIDDKPVGNYIKVAKAAIEAMREPSEKMIEAVGKGSQFPPYILDTKGKYQAMIDEILKE